MRWYLGNARQTGWRKADERRATLHHRLRRVVPPACHRGNGLLLLHPPAGGSLPELRCADVARRVARLENRGAIHASKLVLRVQLARLAATRGTHAARYARDEQDAAVIRTPA